MRSGVRQVQSQKYYRLAKIQVRLSGVLSSRRAWRETTEDGGNEPRTSLRVSSAEKQASGLLWGLRGRTPRQSFSLGNVAGATRNLRTQNINWRNHRRYQASTIQSGFINVLGYERIASSGKI